MSPILCSRLNINHDKYTLNSCADRLDAILVVLAGLIGVRLNLNQDNRLKGLELATTIRF